MQRVQHQMIEGGQEQHRRKEQLRCRVMHQRHVRRQRRRKRRRPRLVDEPWAFSKARHVTNRLRVPGV